MRRANPKYVLRNYLAQQAIEGLERDDATVIERLMDVLRNPYDEQPAHEESRTGGLNGPAIRRDVRRCHAALNTSCDKGRQRASMRDGTSLLMRDIWDGIPEASGRLKHGRLKR